VYELIVKKSSLLVLGGLGLALLFFSKKKDESAGQGSLGGAPASWGADSILAGMDSLVRNALNSIQTITPLPSTIGPSWNALPDGLSPADSARGSNTQAVYFMTPQGERGIAAGGSQTSGNVTYSNVGGTIYARYGSAPNVLGAPTAQQLVQTFGGSINAFGQPVSVAPGRTSPGILAGQTSKYFTR
jgi:hypothetical protein